MKPRKIMKLEKKSDTAVMPIRSSENSVGYDLFPTRRGRIKPKETVIVDTGYAVLPPAGTYVRIDSRSSMALRGYQVITHIVDPDYRGSLKVFIRNTSDEDLWLHPQEAVAQFWLPSFSTPEIELGQLPETSRLDRYVSHEE